MRANRRTEANCMSDAVHTPSRPHASNFGLPVALFERDGSTLIVRVCGPTLGQHEAPELASLVGHALERESTTTSRVILDLTAVAAISSMGLGTCLDLRRRGEALGAETTLIGLSSLLRNVIRTMRLDRLFTIAAPEDALSRQYALRS